MANVGQIDRVFRVLTGVALLTLPFILGADGGPIAAMGGFGWVSMIAGAVLLVTGVVRFCPLYRILGIRTCKISSNLGK